MSSNTMSILKRKIYILFGVGALCAITYFLIIHFFYILNSYIYTAEFHCLFLINNLKAANVPLLSEYFKTLGPVACLPQLFLAQFITAFITPFSWSALAVSIINAFGPGSGILLNIITSTLMGMCIFGLGVFFLGGIPLFKDKASFSKSLWMQVVLCTLYCIPYLTILLPSILAALFKIKFRNFIIFMVSGILIKMALVYIH